MSVFLLTVKSIYQSNPTCMCTPVPNSVPSSPTTIPVKKTEIGAPLRVSAQ